MSIELYIELRNLIGWEPITGIEEVNIFIARYTDTDFQEAVLHNDCIGCLIIHHACKNNAPVSVIQLLEHQWKSVSD